MVSTASKMNGVPAVAAPHVGFFWFVREAGFWHLVADRMPVAEAEPYGDCRTHPGGHYELWTMLAGKGHSWLKANGFPTLITSSEYEAHPRGRVVYDTVSEGFVIYLDPRIYGPQFRACLKAAFGLGGQKLTFRRDAHYQPQI